MSIDIRTLGPSDLGILQNTAAGVFDHDIDPDLVSGFLADPRHHLVVAIDAGTVVGMASAVDYIHPDKPVELWINEVGVAPTYRRRGVARKLLQRLFELGQELGCDEAWLVTSPDNEPAQGLYRGLGGKSDRTTTYSFRLNELGAPQR